MIWGSGFITQIIYAAAGSVADDAFAILTENSLNILTETGIDIEVEH